jgi:hypothetical protein
MTDPESWWEMLNLLASEEGELAKKDREAAEAEDREVAVFYGRSGSSEEESRIRQLLTIDVVGVTSQYGKSRTTVMIHFPLI